MGSDKQDNLANDFVNMCLAPIQQESEEAMAELFNSSWVRYTVSSKANSAKWSGAASVEANKLANTTIYYSQFRPTYA